MHEFVKCNRNDGIHLKMPDGEDFCSTMKRRTHKVRDANNSNYNEIENHKIAFNKIWRKSISDKHDNFCLLADFYKVIVLSTRKTSSRQGDKSQQVTHLIKWKYTKSIIFLHFWYFFVNSSFAQANARLFYIGICIKLQHQVHYNWIFGAVRDRRAW